MKRKLILLSYLLLTINNNIFANNNPIGITDHSVVARAGEHVKNEGIIKYNGYRGMHATDGGSVSNEGEIKIQGAIGISAKGVGSVGINKQQGTILNIGKQGMQSTDGATIINEGTIFNTGSVGMYSQQSGSRAINKGTIINKGPYGMTGSSRATVINEGTIINKGSYGMTGLIGATVINKGTIRNKGSYGMSGSSGATIINGRTGIISNIKDIKLYAENGSIAINEGTINHIVNGQSGIFLENSGTSRSTGTINVTKGIGIKANNSNFYSSGTINVTEGIGVKVNNSNFYNFGTINVTKGIGVKVNNSNFYNSRNINATGQTAIEMDNNDSILELGGGTILKGNTDGLAGEDTLVLSGNGSIDVGVGDHSVNNFEKLVVTGDIIAKGTYNIGVSNGNGYKTSAFGPITTYDIDRVTEAGGDLSVDGTINLSVDYDGIGANDTDKTGKIIANTITKTSRGHIILVKGGSTADDILTEALNNNSNIDSFRVKNIVTSGTAQPVLTDFFEMNPDTQGNRGAWKSITIGDRAGQNGAILLDQKYYKTIPMSTLVPAAQTTHMSTSVPATQTTHMSTSVPATQTTHMSTLVPATQTTHTSTLVPATQTTHMSTLVPATKITKVIKKSKILIPRNKIDLDNINEITRVTQKLRNLNTRGLEAKESTFDIDYLGSKQNRDFHGHKDYNYDYKSHSNGFLGTYMYKLDNNFTLGTAISYNQANVTYGDIRLQNINIKAPIKSHKEKIDSFNTQIYGRYEYGLWDLDLGVGYGVNKHKLNTNFLSGIKQSKYNSYLLKTGGMLSYEFPLTKTLSIVPLGGIDYLNLSEGDIEFNNSNLNIKQEKNGMLVETIGLSLRKNVGKFRYDAGIKYEYNTKEALHKKKEVENAPLEVEALKLDRHTMVVEIDMQYSLNELVGIHGGYSYRYNKNYKNHNINLGINIKFANPKELAVTVAKIPMEIISQPIF